MAENKVQLVIEALSKTDAAFNDLKRHLQDTQTGVQQTNGVLQTMKNHWMALTAAAVGVGLAFQKVMQYIDLGGKALKAEEAFKAMAEAGEVNAARLRAAMNKAADGMVDDSDQMQRAAFAMAQDIDPEKIPQLFEAARLAARKTGRDVGEAIDGMIQGIATNMPRSLRQMGAVTKEQMNLLNKAAAEGVTEINLLDLVLANAAVDQAKFGASADNAAKGIKRLKVEVQEFKEELGKGIIDLLGKLWNGLKISAGGALLLAAGLRAVAAGNLENTARQKEEFYNRFSAGATPENQTKMLRDWQNAKYQADQAWQRYEDLKERARKVGQSGMEALGLRAPEGGDERSPDQKKNDIAKAEADRGAVMAKIQAEIDAAKAAKKAETDAESAKKAAERLAEQWVDTVRTLNAQIAGEGLEDFDKKLIDIQKDSEKLKAEFKTIPGAAALIDQAARALENDAATESAKKGFEEYLKYVQLQNQRNLSSQM